MTDSVLDGLCELLGYSGDTGHLDGLEAAMNAIGCSSALRAAMASIDLHSCFGAWEPGFGDRAPRRYVPIVYLARAGSMAEARRHHRWVWSQGLVPWLIVAVDDQFVVCPGFDFAADNEWPHLVRSVPAVDLLVRNASTLLEDFSAPRLKSSLQWRDFRLHAAGTVDKRLLKALDHLHQRLSAVLECGELAAGTINRLIGRVLYTFLLLDRNIVPRAWVSALGTQDLHSAGGKTQPIPIDEFWALQDQIDDIFNGAVFVIEADERSRFRQEHLDLAIEYLRGGTTLHAGGEQTEFFDIDLTAIQIETLSAVYEEFLRSESPDSVRDDGVVYTPPFLVDFVVNRIDDEEEFNTNSRVLDPTAGSGVFLVAAFRRIVERVLSERQVQRLPLAELRSILEQCIYGVEKAASAAAVAAFSLYLNLLEYADPSELVNIVQERRRPRVFPALIGSNIIVADFFGSARYFEGISFSSIVGNPPWKPLPKVTTCEVDNNGPVDGDDAAEHVTWISLRRYLRADGMLGLVMPSKSMASPSAKTFMTALGRAFHVRAIVNLSQWRRHLFENAGQPAALLFVANRAVTHASRTAFYSPALWTQPFAPKAMWTLTIDRADVQWLPSAFVFREQEQVFDAYALRPLDRAAKVRLRQAVARGAATTFGDLLKRFGLVSAGGSTPARTSLTAGEICAASDLEVCGEGFSTLEDHPKRLSTRRLLVCNETHRAKFQGDRLIVSRSLNQAVQLSIPLAVNSTMNVVHWEEPTSPVVPVSARAAVLAKLGRFLMSDFARFQFALFGQLWQVDRTRIERRDLNKLVVPLPDYFLRNDKADPGTRDFISAMQLDDVIEAMDDYLQTRAQFENGRSPPLANDHLDEVPKEYLSALGTSLRGGFGPLFVACRSGELGGAIAKIDIEVNEPLPRPPIAAGSSSFQFYDSAQVSWQEGGRHIAIEKPVGRLYFSLDRAYCDALRVVNLLLMAE